MAGPRPLNVDAVADAARRRKIRLGSTCSTTGRRRSTGQTARARGTVDDNPDARSAVDDSRERQADGRRAQSADPIGDRQVTVEVKATVLR